MKKAVLISCFDWYRDRVIYYEKYLHEKGYDVQVWMSDYNHFKKVRVTPIEGCNYIHVYAYKKNLSIARLLSHFDFGEQMYGVLKNERPDVIIALVPPNSVSYICGKYKKHHPEIKLIFDIIDMWPESYTASRLIERPFKLWADRRDNNLKYADHIFTECCLYQEFLPIDCRDKMSELYLFRDSSAFTDIPKWNGREIKIGYLGSINNLIDIPLIEELIGFLTKLMKVKVHIVGGGSNAQNLVEGLNRVGADVENHGVIFDKDKVRSIIGQCHFGLNIMKSSVCVGLTIKSLDYFQMGLPMLNTIKGDTSKIIEEYGCGYNVRSPQKCSVLLHNLDETNYKLLRNNTQKAFIDKFTLDSFTKHMTAGLCKLV